MKKQLLFISLFFLSIFAYSNEPVYKTFIIDGIKQSYWVTLSDLKEYDEKGNIIKEKNTLRDITREYDENNNCIHEINIFAVTLRYESFITYDSSINKPTHIVKKTYNLLLNQLKSTDETWLSYDQYGNLILEKSKHTEEYKTTDTYTYKAETDSKGNIIHRIRTGDEKAFEQRIEYNENNKPIHFTENNEAEYYQEYDEAGNVCYEKRTGFEPYEAYITYNDNKQYSSITSTGTYNYTEVYEYNDSGKFIHLIRSGDDSFEVWKEYDSLNRLIHEKRIGTEPFENFFSYDTKNNRIYEKIMKYDGTFTEYFFEYEFFEDGSLKKKFEYITEI